MPNEVKVKITADTKGVDDMQRSLNALGKSEGLRNLREGLSQLGQKLADPIDKASALNESINAVNVTFGESSDVIKKWGEENANAFGLSQRSFNQLATPLGAMLKNSGMALDQVADSTINLTKRAADMASVFNTSVDDALGTITAALRGETDPIERYGVSMKAVTVNAKALAMTGKESAEALTEQEKAAARLAVIFEQTSQVEGDFKNTSEGLANAQRILKASLEDSQTEVVSKFLPALEKGIGVFASMPPAVQLGAKALVDFGPAAAQTAIGISAMAGALPAAAKGLAALATAGKSTLLVLGPLGLAVGAAVAAYEIFGQKAAEVDPELAAMFTEEQKLQIVTEALASATDKYATDSLTKLRDNLADSIEKKKAAAKKSEELAEAEATAKRKTGDFTQTVADLIKPLEKMAEKADAAFGAIDKFKNAPTQEQLELNAAIASQEELVARMNKGWVESAGARDAANASIDRQIEALERIKPANEAQEESIKRQIEQLEKSRPVKSEAQQLAERELETLQASKTAMDAAREKAAAMSKAKLGASGAVELLGQKESDAIGAIEGATNKIADQEGAAARTKDELARMTKLGIDPAIKRWKELEREMSKDITGNVHIDTGSGRGGFGFPGDDDGHAVGGIVTSPVITVGEHGPERVRLPHGSMVYTAQQTRRQRTANGNEPSWENSRSRGQRSGASGGGRQATGVAMISTGNMRSKPAAFSTMGGVNFNGPINIIQNQRQDDVQKALANTAYLLHLELRARGLV